MAIFLPNNKWRDEQLRKFVNEEDISDTGVNVNSYTHMWAVLIDKRYTGVKGGIRAIMPREKYSNAWLIVPQPE